MFMHDDVVEVSYSGNTPDSDNPTRRKLKRLNYQFNYELYRCLFIAYLYLFSDSSFGFCRKSEEKVTTKQHCSFGVREDEPSKNFIPSFYFFPVLFLQ